MTHASNDDPDTDLKKTGVCLAALAHNFYDNAIKQRGKGKISVILPGDYISLQKILLHMYCLTSIQG